MLVDQPDQHVDAGDGHALGRLGQPLDADRAGRDVHQLAGMLAEEMVVVRRVGVEIGLGAFHRDLAQQARLGELVQRVVDRGERHRHFARQRLLVQRLRRDMAVALGEQQMRQRHALPRGPKPAPRRSLATSPAGFGWQFHACPKAACASVDPSDEFRENIGWKPRPAATSRPLTRVRRALDAELPSSAPLRTPFAAKAAASGSPMRGDAGF